MIGIERDAHAGLDVQAHGVHADRLGERGPQPRRDLTGGGRVPHGREQHRELVATQPGHHVARPHAVHEPVRHHAEQPVTDRMPEGVVDLLEAVQVEQQQADVAAVRGGHVDWEAPARSGAQGTCG